VYVQLDVENGLKHSYMTNNNIENH